MAGHVREIAVGHLLRAVEPQLLEACAVEHWHDGARTHAMERRVENGDVPRAGSGLPEHRRDKGGVNLLLHELHATTGNAGVEALAVHRVTPHHAVDDPLVVRRQHLHAASPVDLHSIVAGGIVAGRHHDAAGALRVANRVGEFRRAAEAAEKEDPKSSREQNLGAELRKVLGAVASVVGDRAGGLLAGMHDAPDVVGQALSALADRAVVDGVGADRIHPAAAAAGAEWDHRPVDIIEFLPDGWLPRSPVDPCRQFTGKLRIAGLCQPVTHRLGGVFGDCARCVGGIDGGETGYERGV